ncbi:MAG: MerC domain-containing protein [Bacteroidota bacterium]|jgi:hypothetical protein|nr:MerC domain-containing protein [Cytophagales bacterium]
MISASKINKADLIGILSSSLCLVHCIAMPFLIAFGAGFITNPIFKYLFLIISFLSIFKATENINNTKISLLLLVSFWGFLFSNLFEEDFRWLEYTGYFFGILTIIGHLLNMKYCKHCSNHNEDES